MSNMTVHFTEHRICFTTR